jgi:hypothetical protein
MCQMSDMKSLLEIKLIFQLIMIKLLLYGQKKEKENKREKI